MSAPSEEQEKQTKASAPMEFAQSVFELLKGGDVDESAIWAYIDENSTKFSQ